MQPARPEAPLGPVLGLDVGTGTIGVAVTDATLRFVFPVTTVGRKGVRRDVETLARIAGERGAVTLVVGLPVGDDGTEGRTARLARQIGDALARLTGLPLHYSDEGYSTVEANHRLARAGVYGPRRRAVVDQAAAIVILEEWIAAHAAPRDTGA